ncbi:MAG: NAD(P)-dependent oxidoreductase [Microthrixaceae bacterium]
MLLLGRGWVGSEIERVAAGHSKVDSVIAIDPPFDPVLAPRDAAATTHLRGLITEGSVDCVINACGRVSGTDLEMDDANHLFVEWLCETLMPTGVRFVHIGSASEYGDPGTSDRLDESTPAAPAGAYATSKTAGSEVVLATQHQGMNTTVARVFNIVGYPIPPVSPVHQWLGDLTDLGPGGGEIVVWWPPTTRDFSLIEDVARALVDLALLDSAPPIVNVCSGVPLRYGDIVAALAGALELDVAIRSLDRPGIERVVGSPTLLREVIGWAPTMSAQVLARRATGQDR